jgi:hypothetical protein
LKAAKAGVLVGEFETESDVDRTALVETGEVRIVGARSVVQQQSSVFYILKMLISIDSMSEFL